MKKYLLIATLCAATVHAEPSGAYLTWMGYNAGYDGTGDYSTMYGAYSGAAATNVQMSSFSGVMSGFGSQRLSDCFASGFRSMQDANRNTSVYAIGANAGRDTYSLSNCFFVGANAGRGLRNVTGRTSICGQFYADRKSNSFYIRTTPGSDGHALSYTNGTLKVNNSTVITEGNVQSVLASPLQSAVSSAVSTTIGNKADKSELRYAFAYVNGINDMTICYDGVLRRGATMLVDGREKHPPLTKWQRDGDSVTLFYDETTVATWRKPYTETDEYEFESLSELGIYNLTFLDADGQEISPTPGASALTLTLQPYGALVHPQDRTITYIKADVEAQIWLAMPEGTSDKARDFIVCIDLPEGLTNQRCEFINMDSYGNVTLGRLSFVCPDMGGIAISDGPSKTLIYFTEIAPDCFLVRSEQVYTIIEGMGGHQ